MHSISNNLFKLRRTNVCGRVCINLNYLHRATGSKLFDLRNKSYDGLGVATHFDFGIKEPEVTSSKVYSAQQFNLSRQRS